MRILFVIVSNCDQVKMIAETLKTIIQSAVTSFIMIYVSTSASTADSSIIYRFFVISTYNRRCTCLYDAVVLSFAGLLCKYNIMGASTKPKVSQNKVRYGIEVHFNIGSRK